MKLKGKRARRPGKTVFEGLSDFGEFNGPAAEMGLAALSALSVVGIHSTISPSFMDLKACAKKPEERESAVQGLWIGLGLGTLASLGIFFMFKKWIPAVVSEVTALALFGIGMVAVNSDRTSQPAKKPVESPVQAPTPTPAPAPAPAPVQPPAPKPELVEM